jgi:hypothetical protein
MKGFPDIAGVLTRKEKGRLFVVELKRPNGKPSPEQVEWMIRLSNAGVACALVRSFEDLVEAMREWGELA